MEAPVEREVEPEVHGDAPVDVAVGDVLVVRLAEQATTGYAWQADVPDGLALVTDAAVPGGPAPGAAGARLLRLRADRPGSYEVGLRLQRAWEAAPLQRRGLTVRVSGRVSRREAYQR
ncbi:protease inhibitor I42 family protein [Vallicoccus soli]|uniref:protease inhibitor I42 family protein n=1 Tax=Vallicoccus soli TaxID=2339232 RepID=UPI001402FD4F|nr:protease inhibitor I42 family protein [Vallicoccus soli]